jgi:uncharacterized protein YbbC (DUF1343 family)
MIEIAPQWLKGCKLRPCIFEPTFHKHVGKMNFGIQVHVDDLSYDHSDFQPYRLFVLIFKAIRSLYPDYEIWRNFPYEYEYDRLDIDLINGGTFLRDWVDDPSSEVQDFEIRVARDEKLWSQHRQQFLLY